MRILLSASRIAAAAAVVIALALLGWQCLDIYAAGSEMPAEAVGGQTVRSAFTREEAARRLDRLSVPLAGCGGVILLAVILHAAAGEQRQVQPGLTPENRLRLIKSRLAELPEEARKEERLRRGLMYAGGIVMAITGGFCLRYLLDPASYPPWETSSMDTVVGALLLHAGLPAVCMLALGMGLSVLCRASILREIRLLQPLPRTAEAAQRQAAPSCDRLRAVLYVLAIVFIVLGVMNGGLRDVLYKAITICTECIGLG